MALDEFVHLFLISEIHQVLAIHVLNVPPNESLRFVRPNSDYEGSIVAH